MSGRKRWDAVLIDDDILVRMSWERGARLKGYSLLALTSPREFFALADQIDFSTPIYVDSNLGNDIRGEDISKEIKALGFREIYLATGYEPSSFPALPWLSGIVGKKAPWDL